MDAGTLLVGLVVSGIGFVAFVYGKKMALPRTMLLGGALMAAPYFTHGAAATAAVGAALAAALWFFRD